MRKLSEMSEEEILVEALRAVPEYRERIRDTHRFVVEDCLRSSLNRIEAMFRAERKQHKQKLPVFVLSRQRTPLRTLRHLPGTERGLQGSRNY